MPAKDKIHGFGSTQRRFTTLGLHPELIVVNNTNPLGPGQYHPKYPDCAYKAKAASWKVKLESEEFSKNLGYKHPQVLCDRQFDRTGGGPGTYDLFNLKRKIGASSFRNVSFGLKERFYNPIKDQTLPPGTHNIKTPKTKFTTTPTFEWDGLASRFKSTEPEYRKAPNRYKVRPYCLADKVLTKRGPYDTFTGPRDATTIKNLFAPAMFKPPDTFFVMPSAMDHLLHHPRKKRCGKFFECDRFPQDMLIVATRKGFSMYQRDENLPGPAEYVISDGIKAPKESPHPFNSSNVNARPPTNWTIHPGPDRYKVKRPTCHLKKHRKNSWVFVSKATRGVSKPESFSTFFM